MWLRVQRVIIFAPIISVVFLGSTKFQLPANLRSYLGLLYVKIIIFLNYKFPSRRISDMSECNAIQAIVNKLIILSYFSCVVHGAVNPFANVFQAHIRTRSKSKISDAVNILSSLMLSLASMSTRLPRLQYSVRIHTFPGSTLAPIMAFRLSWRISRIYTRTTCRTCHRKITRLLLLLQTVYWKVSRRVFCQNLNSCRLMRNNFQL